jgi:hypothetical protein
VLQSSSTWWLSFKCEKIVFFILGTLRNTKKQSRRHPLFCSYHEGTYSWYLVPLYCKYRLDISYRSPVCCNLEFSPCFACSKQRLCKLLFCSSLGSVCSRDMMLRLILLRLLLSDGMWFRYMMQGIWYLWINPSMPWKCFTVGHVASLLAVMPLLFRNKLPQNQEGQSQHRSPLTSYNL